jgi:hypothetical protein
VPTNIDLNEKFETKAKEMTQLFYQAILILIFIIFLLLFPEREFFCMATDHHISVVGGELFVSFEF